MQVLTRPWGAMHFHSDGPPSGPAIVFANSLGTDLRLWDALLPLLPADWRCLRYDKPGHGLSDDGGAVSIQTLADDAIALIEAQDCAPVIFVGLSIGGLIAQQVTARRPDLIRALILSNTAARIGTAESWNSRIAAISSGGISSIADGVMERWFSRSFRATPALAAWRNMLTRTSATGYIACCRAIAAADLTSQTAQLRVPTLAIASELDGATPPDLVAGTAALIPGARFHSIPRAGHLPCVEQPQAYASLLIPFLQENRR